LPGRGVYGRHNHAETQSQADLGGGLLSLLPLWLISLAITGEGFPSPPLSFELGKWLIALALPLGLLMLWKRWLSAALFLYSLAPLTFLFIFDEISTTYKTPFILLSTLILTLGVLALPRLPHPKAAHLGLVGGVGDHVVFREQCHLPFLGDDRPIGLCRMLSGLHRLRPLAGRRNPVVETLLQPLSWYALTG
jgi:hypothetical protein